MAGIVANLHDVVIIVGFFAFFQWEFSLAVLAAVLAVLGYSVNESVVIFDRVREAFRKYRKMNSREGDRPRHHQHHQPHHHHPRLHADDGDVDALRRRHAALLRAGADDRHPVRHLLVGVRRRGIAMWLGVKREDLVRQGPRRRIRTTRTPGPWCRVLPSPRRHAPDPHRPDPTATHGDLALDPVRARPAGPARLRRRGAARTPAWWRAIEGRPRDRQPVGRAGAGDARRDLVLDLQKAAPFWQQGMISMMRSGLTSGMVSASRPGDLPQPGSRAAAASAWSTTTPSSTRSSARAWRWR